ncbi:squamosa promoter-binding protein 1 [Cucumis sativus]|uniref:SBP-type domain-containing protein n=1 Tax=Cucumis sativus TaxID=3659 RepID=A0A0A0KK74_CUCSA|nr:squamosa promoter-binding protein 1 [Cucumis sativus]KGN49239.1 hypothetical protein Csa_003123 [Cucumis sativus]
MANSEDQGWEDMIVDDDDDDNDNEEIGFVDNERRRRSGLTSARGGGGGGRSTVARCQADGCNADLTGAKPYHRRHKVCEFHSRAAVVILAGLEQRFCQQCSRFHALSEFDDTKRSCRMRLAGHNERRRKILPDFHGQSSTN